MLIRMPKLLTLSREQVAALAGLAPFDDDSGKRKGSRHIAGGRENKRNLPPSGCTKTPAFFARCAEPRSTIKKISRAAPLIRRLGNSLQTAPLTRPLSLIMNRIFPRDGIAGIRRMPWREPVA
jgi:Transposase IS116/IS110/IS902 family